MKVLEFLGSSTGRIVRGLAGVLIIALGYFLSAGAWQWVLILVGLVPLAAGLFDFCLFAPLFGLPFLGEKLRNKFNS